MGSGEIAEVKITIETQIQGVLTVWFLLRKLFIMEGMCMLFLFLFHLIYHFVVN